MSSDATTQVISKEFLEKALGKKVESFSIVQRPDTGDNFMSVLYTVEVTVISDDKGKDKNSREKIHLISKCFPSNPGTQAFLNSNGMFWKELDFYKIWLPELLKFTKELDLKEAIKLNYPTFIAGNTQKHGKDENINKEMKSSGHFENYVIMVDVCKTSGFKLANRLVRLDKDHLVLAVEALAKMHALSWAFKTHKKIEVITDKFPALEFDYESSRNTYETVMDSTIDGEVDIVKANPEMNPEIPTRLTNFKGPLKTVMAALFGAAEPEKDIEKCFRVKPTEIPESPEVPWRVVIHGDCQMTNMLFRYNAETNKPEEIVLVDLQMARESSPLIDLVYFMYTSTFFETREKHCDEILELYYEKFNYFCEMFNTETLPGFTLKELRRRYQRSKIFGFVIGFMIAPIFLKEKDKAVQMDSLEGMSQEEIMKIVQKGMSKNPRYVNNVNLLAQEAYDVGAI